MIKIIPKKEFGQHFIKDADILKREIKYAKIGKNDTVLEIGPGTGNLTELLAQKAKKVIAIEKDKQFKDMFGLIGSGKTAKESIPEILTWLAENEDATVKDALESLGLSMMSRKELEDLIDDIIKKNSEFIELRGKGAFGPLMGIIMKKARGRVKAKLVNETLKSRLDNESH